MKQIQQIPTIGNITGKVLTSKSIQEKNEIYSHDE